MWKQRTKQNTTTHLVPLRLLSSTVLSSIFFASFDLSTCWHDWTKGSSSKNERQQPDAGGRSAELRHTDDCAHSEAHWAQWLRKPQMINWTGSSASKTHSLNTVYIRLFLTVCSSDTVTVSWSFCRGSLEPSGLNHSLLEPIFIRTRWSDHSAWDSPEICAVY